MANSDPIEPESRRFSIRLPPSLWFGVATAVVLVGGFVVCGGTLALPVLIQRQRRAEEAARRAQAVENLKRIGHAMQKNAEQDADKSPEATQASGDST